MKLIGLAGSLRKESYNRKLLAVAAKIADDLGTPMEIITIDDVPLYNADVEAAGMPAGVEKFRTSIKAADAILIVTPEYNNSFPGVLKNAIDWASTNGNCWDGKVVALAGATVGVMGTALAQAQLRNVFNILNAFLVPHPFVYLPKAQEAFDEAGNLTNETTRKNLEAVLKRLVKVTAAHKQA